MTIQNAGGIGNFSASHVQAGRTNADSSSTLHTLKGASQARPSMSTSRTESTSGPSNLSNAKPANPDKKATFMGKLCENVKTFLSKAATGLGGALVGALLVGLVGGAALGPAGALLGIAMGAVGGAKFALG